MKIRFYGRLADTIGRDVELDTPLGCSVAELRTRLIGMHPTAGETLTQSRASLHDGLVGDQQQLAPDDDVEFLPPVSGG